MSTVVQEKYERNIKRWQEYDEGVMMLEHKIDNRGKVIRT